MWYAKDESPEKKEKQMIRGHLMRAIFITLMLLTLGGCSKDEPVVEKCIAGEYIRNGEFVLVNDKDTYSGYAQCIFADSRDQSFGWTWEETPEASQWSSNSYMYVFYGKPPNNSPLLLIHDESSTPALPFPVENLALLTIDYDVSVATTSRYRLGFRASEVAGCTVGYCSLTTLSIIIHSDLPSDSVYFQKRVIVDGEKYDFYQDISSEQSSVWAYWFVKVDSSHSGTLHLHKFLNFLKNEGYNSSFDIEQIEFFQDIKEGGSGKTDIRTFSVNVTPREE